MSDLVERLRQGAGHVPEDIQSAEQAMAEAADTIERLRQQIELANRAADNLNTEIFRLRAVLNAIRDKDADWNYFDGPHGGWIRQQIDAALGQKEAADEGGER